MASDPCFQAAIAVPSGPTARSGSEADWPAAEMKLAAEKAPPAGRVATSMRSERFHSAVALPWLSKAT
ncbi:MAG: hypothetical protein M3N16_07020, partial [Actinomycetota bacterium]|nr:hypothetical protein [Actinomycetota bacterium]